MATSTSAAQQDWRPAYGQPSPQLVEFVLEHIGPICERLFRPTLQGLENLPEDGPFLLVANHSAGLGFAEIFCFAWLYTRHAGPERLLAGFAHRAGFRLPPIRWLHEQIGSVPSTYEHAFEALAQGVPLLVFPGGDYECLRPIWQADTVDFNGRRGFLKIAEEANIPVVPMGIQGSHYTVPIFARSKTLATLLIQPRLLGTKRWGVSALGLAGAGAILSSLLPLSIKLPATYLWLGSPLIFLPILPATIRFRIGAPIEPEALFDDQDPELDEALETVERRIEDLIQQAKKAR